LDIRRLGQESMDLTKYTKTFAIIAFVATLFSCSEFQNSKPSGYYVGNVHNPYYAFNPQPSSQKIANFIQRYNHTNVGLASKIATFAACFEVDAAYLTAIFRQESNIDAFKTSPTGAIGIGQITTIGFMEINDQFGVGTKGADPGAINFFTTRRDRCWRELGLGSWVKPASPQQIFGNYDQGILYAAVHLKLLAALHEGDYFTAARDYNGDVNWHSSGEQTRIFYAKQVKRYADELMGMPGDNVTPGTSSGPVVEEVALAAADSSDQIISCPENYWKAAYYDGFSVWDRDDVKVIQQDSSLFGRECLKNNLEYKNLNFFVAQTKSVKPTNGQAFAFIEDNYSAIFQRIISVDQAGDYVFALKNVDDGAKIFINGEEILAIWDAQQGPFEATRRLARGTHKIVIKYVERGYSASFEYSIRKK
jgi:hypothetical protein